METKKTKLADLEPKRGLFYQIGLILVLSVVFVAFEWPSKEINIEKLTTTGTDVFEYDVPPITFRKEEELPKIELPKPPVITEIKIVSNETDVKKDIEITNTEVLKSFKFDFSATESKEEIETEILFITCEEPAIFPGGQSALMEFVVNELVYPQDAIDNGIEGRVTVSFVVSKTGEIKDIKILKGIDRQLNQAAIDVVQKLPKWKAAKQRGKEVNFAVNLPINFILNH